MAISVNGQLLVQPQANVQVVQSGSIPQGAASSRTLWLLGSASDGEPNTILTFNSLASAFQTLKDGDLMQGLVFAFSGSSIAPGPQQISVIRTDSATQATGTILGPSAATEIALTANSYGVIGNLYKWMVSAASGGTGYLVKVGSDYTGPATSPQVVSQDNIYLPVLSIYYSGTGTTPTVTVTDTEITLTAVTSDTGGSVAFTAGMTVSSLVAQLNQLAGWNVTAADPNTSDLLLPTDVVPGTNTPSLPALMDNVTSVAVGTTAAAATTLYANVAAVVRYLNSGVQGFVTAIRHAGATSLTTGSTFTYLSGGTYTAPTSTTWQNAFDVLENVDGNGVVVPLTSTQAYWQMALTHVNYMEGYGSYRFAIVGDTTGQTLATEITNAASLNSPRVILRWPGFVATNLYGQTTTFQPYFEAARTGGIMVGAPVYQSLTLIPLSIQGLETVVTKAQIDQAIQAGICITKQYGTGYAIAASVSTWTGGSQFDMVNPATLACEDQTRSDLKTALEQGLIGYASNISPLVVQTGYSIAQGVLNNEAANGVLTGSSANPAYQNLTVTVSGQTVNLSALIHPALATNYAVMQLTATPWAG